MESHLIYVANKAYQMTFKFKKKTVQMKRISLEHCGNCKTKLTVVMPIQFYVFMDLAIWLYLKWGHKKRFRLMPELGL